MTRDPHEPMNPWPAIRCPRCGEPAAFLVSPVQAFCGNELCNVLAWNPLDPESWNREHVVTLVNQDEHEDE